jgi:hypothetical protein
LIVNVSQGGACLWLGDPPRDAQSLTVHFHAHGQDHELRSRLIWSRACAATNSAGNLGRAVGWLAGIAFAEENDQVHDAETPRAILRNGQAMVGLEENQGPSPEQTQSNAEQTQDLITLDSRSAHGIRAATTELMPVFAKHFSDVHIVLKREQLEISASFRAAEMQAEEQDVASTGFPTDGAANETTDMAHAANEATEAVRTGRNAGTSLRLSSWKRSLHKRRRQWLVAMGGGVIAFALAGMLGNWSQRSYENVSATLPEDTVAQDTHAWVAGLHATDLTDWMNVGVAFNLPEASTQAIIGLLAENDIYPPAHDLYDLSKYPLQAARALALVSRWQGTNGETADLGKLKNNLESRLIAGARFPDEAPGGRYSSLQRELYNNVVVLGIVDMFYRQQDDPVVRQVLASLARSDQLNAAAQPAALSAGTSSE